MRNTRVLEKLQNRDLPKPELFCPEKNIFYLWLPKSKLYFMPFRKNFLKYPRGHSIPNRLKNISEQDLIIWLTVPGQPPQFYLVHVSIGNASGLNALA